MKKENDYAMMKINTSEVIQKLVIQFQEEPG